jgi:hypothetical protein
MSSEDGYPGTGDTVIDRLDNDPNIRIWSEEECSFYLGTIFGEFRRQLAIAERITDPAVQTALARMCRVIPQIAARVSVLSDHPPPRGRPK